MLFQADTIEFDQSLEGDTITLSSQITIDKNLTIDGTVIGSQVEISGGNSVRVFEITGNVEVEIIKLTIRNGNESSGGGIYVDGGDTLTLQNCVIKDNYANTGGGNL